MLVRDPVHGDLNLNAVEQRVLDTAAMQRMRGIKQLGTASLVYPGAVHTRFDHSLGVNAVAKRIIAQLRESGAAIDLELETIIGVAALLHDVTHVPFGHTLEDERRLFERHDKGDRLRRLLDGPLGETLEALDLKGAIVQMFAPTAAGDATAGSSGKDAVPAWAKEIVSSTIDADLLDYLRRDSYFAGLAQQYDDRILRHFCVDGGHLAINMSKHGMERQDARSETVQLLRMRYFLTERVYYHHTKVTAGAMVSKAVELAQEHDRLGEDELMRLNDGQLFEALRGIAEATQPDARIGGLIERLERRHLLKRGYVLSALTVDENARRTLVERFHHSAANRRAAEEHVARQVGCDVSEVIVYCPALTVMKEAAALVRGARGLVALNQTSAGANSEIAALQARYAELWRFYIFVPAEHVDAAAPIGREILGYPSEHIAAGR